MTVPARGALDELIVENLGIIERAQLEPGSGLVVFTGETGAGKTLLLGALRLLLGAPARRDLVGPHGEQAVVQGRFSLDGDEVVAVRRLTASGKSRAYLDGIMAPVGALGLRLGGSVELTAQHTHVLLGRPEHLSGTSSTPSPGTRGRVPAPPTPRRGCVP